MPQELLSPVGRIVWGNPGKPQIKKDNNQQPVIKDGQQVQQWTFGLAIPKADFEQHVWPVMAAEIATGFPQGIPPNFSYKFKDGDGVDHRGVPFANREGHAGCKILTISTEAFAPPLYKLNPQTGQYDQYPAEQIKTGDYVRVSLNFKVNVPTNQAHTPGIYVNPNGIEFVGYGEEIHNGPDAQSMFGGQAAALPAGASATPMASSNAPGMPTAPQPGQQPYAPQAPTAPQPGQQPYAPQAPTAPQPGQPMPAPAQDFVPGQQPYAPQAPQPYAPQAPQPGQPQYAPQAPTAPQPGQQPYAPQVPGAMPQR